MKDIQFENELKINAFVNQIDGYPFGHPYRSLQFKPIISFIKKDDGTFNRERTLDGTEYTFTDEQRKLLLDNSETQ